MALLESEIMRLRFECGYNVLNAGAEPYVSVVAIFNQVIATYMQAGATTTSSTTVVDVTTPVPVALTLASATGFAAGQRVWIDVDTRQESATVQSIAGSTITVQLQNPHTGTYPVTVDGGEGMVRSLLRRLDQVQAAIAIGYQSAGIKKVDEVEFYGNSYPTGGSRIRMLYEAQMRIRDELCSALSVPNYWRRASDSAATVSIY